MVYVFNKKKAATTKSPSTNFRYGENIPTVLRVLLVFVALVKKVGRGEGGYCFTSKHTHTHTQENTLYKFIHSRIFLYHCGYRKIKCEQTHTAIKSRLCTLKHTLIQIRLIHCAERERERVRTIFVFDCGIPPPSSVLLASNENSNI